MSRSSCSPHRRRRYPGSPGGSWRGPRPAYQQQTTPPPRRAVTNPPPRSNERPNSTVRDLRDQYREERRPATRRTASHRGGSRRNGNSRPRPDDRSSCTSTARPVTAQSTTTEATQNQQQHRVPTNARFAAMQQQYIDRAEAAKDSGYEGCADQIALRGTLSAPDEEEEEDEGGTAVSNTTTNRSVSLAQTPSGVARTELTKPMRAAGWLSMKWRFWEENDVRTFPAVPDETFAEFAERMFPWRSLQAVQSKYRKLLRIDRGLDPKSFKDENREIKSELRSKKDELETQKAKYDRLQNDKLRLQEDARKKQDLLEHELERSARKISELEHDNDKLVREKERFSQRCKMLQRKLHGQRPPTTPQHPTPQHSASQRITPPREDAIENEDSDGVPEMRAYVESGKKS